MHRSGALLLDFCTTHSSILIAVLDSWCMYGIGGTAQLAPRAAVARSFTPGVLRAALFTSFHTLHPGKIVGYPQAK